MYAFTPDVALADVAAEHESATALVARPPLAAQWRRHNPARNRGVLRKEGRRTKHSQTVPVATFDSILIKISYPYERAAVDGDTT